MTILLNSLAFLGTQELIIIGVIILIFFGGAKIPSLMRGLGRGMGEFKKGIDEGKRSFEEMGNDDEPSTKAN
ncbi:MAG: twin-arginine translocase TatA/TatE family subunit [Armatimonadetes bacterium]|nr:twin-arginine translocase TatA/TatE family subunit [Armatimonadota bacterium]MBS1711956.1 twin-arginine translocase TatA/TatE family subunit [Armatimonadota bacterium]MBX3109490.1 twin-arginine translocase TatA/TatE family subunit [Fimbriimonadaceae bacterium]